MSVLDGLICHPIDLNWYEQWEFAESGLMRRREASINDVSILQGRGYANEESARKFR